jgi:DNA-binding CsgD family transcriptional regulator
MSPELAALSPPTTGPNGPNGPSERGCDDGMGRSGVPVGRSGGPVGRFERATTGTGMHRGAQRAHPEAGRGRQLDSIEVRQRPTRRQVEIFRAYITAGSVASAAQELGITETTVRQHLSGLYRRIGVANAAQAAYLLGKAENTRPGVPTPSRRVTPLTPQVMRSPWRNADHPLAILADRPGESS